MAATGNLSAAIARTPRESSQQCPDLPGGPACKTGVLPRDAELAFARTRTSPGLAAMCTRAGAALPFAAAADLLADLAGLAAPAKPPTHRCAHP